MNKLLSFNPEPFEPESEVEAAAQGSGAVGESYEQEGKFEFNRRRGGARSARPRHSSLYGAAPGSNRGRVGPQPRPQVRGFRWADYPVAMPIRPMIANPDAVGDARRWAPDDPGAEPEPSSGDGSGFVRWAQGCLNRDLSLTLPIDGVFDARTRSAIRTFQERRGLAITGRIGPATEAALKETCRALSGATAPDLPASRDEFEWEVAPRARRGTARRRPPGAGGIGTSSATVGGLRESIVRIAKQELARWNNGAIKETDLLVRALLRDYWKTGAGVDYSEAQLGSPLFQADHPWSAAFISWVMRKAGAGDSFKYSSAHSVYTCAAKENRLTNNGNPFKAYRISEIAPREGDLVCKRRAHSGATYDNIRPGMKTHCDIVTEVRPDGLTIIGGNVSNSVSRRTLRINDQGQITDPDYFAVIRVGEFEAPLPIKPPPFPIPPSVTGAPTLLKRESTPPGASLYVDVDLNIIDAFKIRAAAMTGIFIPEGFTPGPAVDIVLYLHGHKAAAVRKLTIDGYWNAKRFPYGAFREGVNASGRNIVLVAPTLGSRSEAGALLQPGGLDAYIAKVLAALRAYGLGQSLRSTPVLGNLIFACHSGGGSPMRRLAGGSDRALAKLRECWGFDCTYNHGDDGFWAAWARNNPNSKCYFHYIRGSQTAPLSESLRDKHVPNAIVLPSKDSRHNFVPIAHWSERLLGAAFLATRSGGGAPLIDPNEPSDLKLLTKQQFIDFVAKLARAAMAATGVPASVTVAQAILETGWGKHTIGAAKNLFGIKGKGPVGMVHAKTLEYVNGKPVVVEANFRKYASFDQSVVDHASLFTRLKRYASAMAAKSDPDRFAREIHKAGYATAPDYATQLISLMHDHDLYRFDRQNEVYFS